MYFYVYGSKSVFTSEMHLTCQVGYKAHISHISQMVNLP